MFFSKKKQEILHRDNILTGCKAIDRSDAIKQVGQLLVNSGYVGEAYVDAMLERENSFSTYMGSGLALPHGVEAAKKEIKSTGIAVMLFPDGVMWEDEKAYIVIGIAGVGEEHLEILGKIADSMMDEELSEKLLSGDADTIYSILNA